MQGGACYKARECSACGAQIIAFTEVQEAEGELVELGSRKSGARKTPEVDKEAVLRRVEMGPTPEGPQIWMVLAPIPGTLQGDGRRSGSNADAARAVHLDAKLVEIAEPSPSPNGRPRDGKNISSARSPSASPSIFLRAPPIARSPRWIGVCSSSLMAVSKRIGTDDPINCSVRMAADMCGVGKSLAATALATLKTKGFIVRVKRGERRQRRGFASSWRITCLPFRGAWPTCDYNHILDRERNRKVADDRKAETRFLTPELEALWVKTEASFMAGTVRRGGQVINGAISGFTAMKSIRCAEVSGRADIYGGNSSISGLLPAYSASVRKGPARKEALGVQRPIRPEDMREARRRAVPNPGAPQLGEHRGGRSGALDQGDDAERSPPRH